MKRCWLQAQGTLWYFKWGASSVTFSTQHYPGMVSSYPVSSVHFFLCFEPRGNSCCSEIDPSYMWQSYSGQTHCVRHYRIYPEVFWHIIFVLLYDLAHQRMFLAVGQSSLFSCSSQCDLICLKVMVKVCVHVSLTPLSVQASTLKH